MSTYPPPGTYARAILDALYQLEVETQAELVQRPGSRAFDRLNGIRSAICCARVAYEQAAQHAPEEN